MNRRNWLPSVLLLLTVIGLGGLLTAWKQHSRAESSTGSQNQPEPVEAVTIAFAAKREHRLTSTSIGTALALRSITLRNELPGTVREVTLEPGAVVEPGQILVALDVAVEQAELAALVATATLATANLKRMQHLANNRAEPPAEVERATSERDVALAQIERMKATIARKTLRAPFRARVGLADLHPGQFLDSGAILTTLQGIDAASHVDFEVAQHVAAELRPGDNVELNVQGEPIAAQARVVAVDARINPATRNATVRARVEESAAWLTPGSSVRVRVSHGKVHDAVAIPASAMRRGPAGDHVFVVEHDPEGRSRVHLRKVQGGPPTGDEVLILSGLSAGERVAASGSFKLREAAQIMVVDQPALALRANR